MSGFGTQPFGSSNYGVGVPASSPEPGGKVLADPAMGLQHGSRRIDPSTKDYVINEHGRLEGMSGTHQLVLLAVTTARGSSALVQLGNTLHSLGRITPNFARRVDFELRRCVEHIVRQGLIEVVETAVNIIRPGTVVALLRWRDLSTGVESDLSIGI